MLSYPNQAAEIVDVFGDFGHCERIMVPAAAELGAGGSRIEGQFGPVGFELGVIAGNVTLKSLFSSLISGPEDGKVSVESTRADGMADQMVLPVTHTFLMNTPLVITQILAVLNSGRLRARATYLEFARRVFDH